MGASFEISYDASFEDLYAASNLYYSVCKSVARPLKVFRIVEILWLAAAGYTFATQPSLRTSPILIGMSVTPLWLLFTSSWQQKRQLKRSWDKQVTPPAQTLPIRIRFDNDEISFLREGKSEARFFWSGILGMYEDESQVLLIVAQRMFYHVPKRVLSPELLSALKSVAPMERKCNC